MSDITNIYYVIFGSLNRSNEFTEQVYVQFWINGWQVWIRFHLSTPFLTHWLAQFRKLFSVLYVTPSVEIRHAQKRGAKWDHFILFEKTFLVYRMWCRQSRGLQCMNGGASLQWILKWHSVPPRNSWSTTTRFTLRKKHLVKKTFLPPTLMNFFPEFWCMWKKCFGHISWSTSTFYCHSLQLHTVCTMQSCYRAVVSW